MRKREIKRVDPLSVGKVYAILGACAGFIFALFAFAFGSMISGIVGPELVNEMGPEFGGINPFRMMTGIGVGMLIIMPIYFAFMLFIWSIIISVLYNLVAKWVGGISIYVEDVGEY